MTAETKNFKPSTDCLTCQHCGADGVQQWALDKLQAMRDEYGKPMVITSAFRCKDHPEESKKAAPGAHTSGCAFDVKVGSGIERMRIVELAIKHGAKGVGVANTFVHVDWWPTRSEPVMWVY